MEDVIKECKPTICVELGTYCSYSTIRIARNLPENGKVYTIDPNEYTSSIAKQLVKKAGLESIVFFF